MYKSIMQLRLIAPARAEKTILGSSYERYISSNILLNTKNITFYTVQVGSTVDVL